MLPDGFQWVPRYQYAQGELALRIGRLTSAQRTQRLDSVWFAQLSPNPDLMARHRVRSASSFEAGKAGIEVWAWRHEAALRAQAASIPPLRIPGLFSGGASLTVPFGPVRHQFEDASTGCRSRWTAVGLRPDTSDGLRNPGTTVRLLSGAPVRAA